MKIDVNISFFDTNNISKKFRVGNHFFLEFGSIFCSKIEFFRKIPKNLNSEGPGPVTSPANTGSAPATLSHTISEPRNTLRAEATDPDVPGYRGAGRTGVRDFPG